MKQSSYYKLLDITIDSSIAEIKSAFRKKAKQLHPDLSLKKTREEKEAAEEKMIELLHAYQNILKEKTKNTGEAEFDFFTEKNRAESFDYRIWLLNRTDYESRAKLIFFDLFHGLETEAVIEYNKRRSEAMGFYLSKYFSREDFMDCGFVLAEELYFRGEYYEAFLLLEEIFYLEKQKPYFKHFFPEIISIIKSIINDKLHNFTEDELAIDCYEAALNLDFENTDKANIFRRMSEVYYRLGDKYAATNCYKEAVRLSPKLMGIKKLQKQLEIL